MEILPLIGGQVALCDQNIQFGSSDLHVNATKTMTTAATIPMTMRHEDDDVVRDGEGVRMPRETANLAC